MDLIKSFFGDPIAAIKTGLYALAGLAIIGAGIYVLHLRSEVKDQAAQIVTISTQRDQALEVNKENTAALAQLKAEDAANLQAVAQDSARSIQDAVKTVTIIKDISHAPNANDPAPAPFIAALDGLRVDAGTGAAH